MGQSSVLNGENGTEKKGDTDNNTNSNANDDVSKKVSNNENDSTNYLKTEAVTLSGLGTGNSTLIGNSTLAENFTFAKKYRLEALDVELKVPSYELPLNKANIANYGNFSGKISLNESALKMLESNGFVVMENPYNPGEEDITSMYKILAQEDVPVFITTDSPCCTYITFSLMKPFAR